MIDDYTLRHTRHIYIYLLSHPLFRCFLLRRAAEMMSRHVISRRFI